MQRSTRFQFARSHVRRLSALSAAILCSAFAVGCGDDDDVAGSNKAATNASTDPAPAAGSKEPPPVPLEDRLYDGRLLSEWRPLIKNIAPESERSSEYVPGLIAIVRDEDVPWVTRRHAIMTLGRMGENAGDGIALLIELLDTPPPSATLPDGEGAPDSTAEPERVAAWAARAIALIGPPARDATPKLIGMLMNPNRTVAERSLALNALASIGPAHPRVMPALVSSLKYGGREAVAIRALAADALARQGPVAATATPALIRATRDRNEGVRLKVVAALGAIGRPAAPAIPRLVEILALDSSEAVRDAAADAMGELGPDAVPELEYLLKDEDDAGVRYRAADALGAIGPPAEEAAEALDLALDDPDARVRMSSAEALWKITAEPTGVVSLLVDELTRPDRRVRVRAVKLLEDMGPKAKSAVAPLEKLLEHDRPYVRSAAKKALEKIRSTQ